jgi:hypothetical protein
MLFFHEEHIVARLGEAEVLPGELFKGVLVRVEVTDLPVHVVDLCIVLLDLPVQPADVPFSLDPPYDVVLVDEADQDQEKEGCEYGITSEGAFLSVLAVLASVP